MVNVIKISRTIKQLKQISFPCKTFFVVFQLFYYKRKKKNILSFHNKWNIGFEKNTPQRRYFHN